MTRVVRLMRLSAWLLALALVAAACGGSDDDGDGGDEGGGGEAAEESDDGGEAQKVGLIFDVGGQGDLSFNDSAFRGLEAAKEELGDQIEVRDLSPNNDGSNRRELIDGLIDEDYGLIIGVGFAFSEDMAAAAEEYPDLSFAVVDGFGCEAENLRCLNFKEHEGSFLVGAAAALKTESEIVGFVGGQEGDLIEKFQAGYEAGVEWVNENEGRNVEVLVDYAGNTVQAFQDPAAGRELALKQVDGGADVLYHAAGLTGNGMIQVAAEEEVLAIGVDSDQSLPDEFAEQRPYILTSMLKRVDNSVQKTIEDFVAGGFEGGVEFLGLAEGGVDYAQNEYNGELLGDLPATLDDLKQQIVDGGITVPETVEG
jgi:basic membrane protein A